MQNRLEFARNWIKCNMDRKNIIWTDEKRFNLDGPDSWSSWMPRSQPICRNRRQQGGDSIQVWGALIPGPFLLIFELPARGDSADSMDFMESKVLPFIKENFSENFVLQQDNNPTHASAFSQNRFAELGFELLQWPARSQDLNIIENCWSLMSSRVYDGQQFSNNADLWAAIDSAVADINANCRPQLEALFASTNSRMLEVIDNKGALTHY